MLRTKNETSINISPLNKLFLYEKTDKVRKDLSYKDAFQSIYKITCLHKYKLLKIHIHTDKPTIQMNDYKQVRDILGLMLVSEAVR